MILLTLMIGLLMAKTNSAQQCQVMGQYTNPSAFNLNLNSGMGYPCTQYYLGPYSSSGSISLTMSNLILNCNANDNILLLTQANQTLYDVCQQQRGGASIFSFSYTAAYFIISLYLNSNTQIGVSISMIINGQQSTLGPVPVTTTPSPVITTQPATAATTPSSSNCGVPYYTPNSALMNIVGGVNANQYSWPWQVLVYNGSELCGGVLIANQWILTAGHCQMNNPTVYLGIYNLNNLGSTGQAIPVSGFYGFGYNSNTMKNDLLLMKLQYPVQYSTTIQPICLPSTMLATVGRVAMVAGWGTTSSGGQISYTLKQVAIPIMANSVCTNHLLNIGAITQQDALDSTQICAGQPGTAFSSTEDSCQGDSGGALFTKDSGHYTLGGLVSYGGPCDGYGVYTNVYPYVSQILSIINSNSG